MLLRRSLSLAVLCLVFAVAACGGDDGGASEEEATPTATQTAAQAQQVGCQEVEAPEPKPDAAKTKKPKLTLDPSKTWLATVATNCGEFTITLDVERAPKTSSAFAGLAREGFFDGLTFHRIVPGFVIQGGDPAGDGTGGPGYSITEKPPADAVYSRGVVAMAKGELERPGTSGSQFFIVTTLDAGLPPDYALVGKVAGDGLEAVNRIEDVPTDGREAPQEPVVIEKATLSED
jgi:cyclophilin family peptidyl-prolyl cis-trans isomerase